MTKSKNLVETMDKFSRLTETDVYKAIEEREKQSEGVVGRPRKITTEVLRLLFISFMKGSDDEGACFHAKIGKTVLYDFQNEYPEFTELKEQWKENPIMKARDTVFQHLDEPEYAFRFLRAKKKAEFSERTELTGANGERLLPNNLEDLKTNYGELAESLIKQLDGQRVENDTPLQNQD